jgi:uncharacterized protein (DUF2345 family)
MIEMTAGGKIDIYAKDSVNVHATTDINLKADRNINIEAGNAINMKSGTNTNFESVADLNIKVGANGRITTGGKTNITAGGIYMTSDPIHFNGPVAEAATGAAAPTRVPGGGGWLGAENRNPAAHIAAQTDNVEGTSSPVVTDDGTTAVQTPADAGEVEVEDTFKQCPPTEVTPTAETTAESNATIVTPNSGAR